MNAKPMFLLSFIVLFVLGGFAKANGQKHDQQHADMTIELPNRPRTDTVDLGDGTKQHRLILAEPSGSIIVWYQAQNPAVGIAEGLERAQQTIEKMAGGKTTDIKLSNGKNVSSRSFRVTIPSNGGEFRVAYYHFDDKNYQVMAVGTPEFTSSQAIDRMFESVDFENGD